MDSNARIASTMLEGIPREIDMSKADLIVFGLVWPILITGSVVVADSFSPNVAHLLGFATGTIFMVHAFICVSRK